MVTEREEKGFLSHDTWAQIDPFLCNQGVKISTMVEFHSSIFTGSSNNGREQWTKLRNEYCVR